MCKYLKKELKNSKHDKTIIFSKKEWSNNKVDKDLFKGYLKEEERDKANRDYAWSTAIGLQMVDGLKPSHYLMDIAVQNIKGKITMKEVQSLIDIYYKEKPVHLRDAGRTEEADKVSSRIVELLTDTMFSFSPNEYISIHYKLFQGISKHAGDVRGYNITKKESRALMLNMIDQCVRYMAWIKHYASKLA